MSIFQCPLPDSLLSLSWSHLFRVLNMQSVFIQGTSGQPANALLEGQDCCSKSCMNKISVLEMSLTPPEGNQQSGFPALSNHPRILQSLLPCDSGRFRWLGHSIFGHVCHMPVTHMPKYRHCTVTWISIPI